MPERSGGSIRLPIDDLADAQQVAVRVPDVELAHAPGLVGEFVHAAGRKVERGVLRVQAVDIGDTQVAGGVLRQVPLLAGPEVQLHAVAPDDRIEIRKVAGGLEAEPVVEGQRLLEVERGEHRDGDIDRFLIAHGTSATCTP